MKLNALEMLKMFQEESGVGRNSNSSVKFWELEQILLCLKEFNENKKCEHLWSWSKDGGRDAKFCVRCLEYDKVSINYGSIDYITGFNDGRKAMEGK